jgi:hypothetical protein
VYRATSLPPSLSLPSIQFKVATSKVRMTIYDLLFLSIFSI